MSQDKPPTVQRYEADIEGTMLKEPDGNWVRFIDYAAQAAEIARLKAHWDFMLESNESVRDGRMTKQVLESKILHAFDAAAKEPPA